MVVSDIMSSATHYPTKPSCSYQQNTYIPPVNSLEFLNYEAAPNTADCSSFVNVFNLKTIHRDDSMIHIIAPETQVLVEKKDGVTKYTAFNIYVNGWFHAAVRFSYLYEFAEFIKAKFGSKYRGPEFPPKKIFQLDERQLQERREKISKYLLALVQTADIMRHPQVEKRFLEMQVNSFRATSINVTVDIHLGDGEKKQIRCTISNSTNEVMRILATQLGFDDSDALMWNFGLFMAHPRKDLSLSSTEFNMICVRLLRNYESPYISLQTVNQKSAAQGIFHKLVLRKLIWNPRIEESLLENDLVTELLYRQAKQDFHNEIFTPNRPEVNDRLRALARNNDKMQFLRTCHLQPTYSYEILKDCLSDYPRPETKCTVKVGRRQLVLMPVNAEECVFNTMRIREWRMTQQNTNELLFQFQYQVNLDDFKWISLQMEAPMGVLLSHLIQSIANEILHENSSMSIEEQLLRHGGGNGMSVFVASNNHSTNRQKTNSISSKDSSNETPIVRKMSDGSMKSQKSQTSLQSARSAITSPEELCSSSSQVADIYNTAFNDVFTTITDTLPLHNEAFANITDDDL